MNPHQGGRYVADHIDLHDAWSNTWRGSHGCLTVMKGCWDKMLAYFNEGDEGNLEIFREFTKKGVNI